MHSETVETLNNMFALLENEYTVGVVPKILLYQHFAQSSDKYKLYKTKDLPFRSIKASLALKTDGENIVSNERWVGYQGYTIQYCLFSRIATLLQSGLLRRSFNDLYSINFCATETRYYKASFEHIRSSVLLFYGGVAISILILIVELILAYCKQSY